VSGIRFAIPLSIYLAATLTAHSQALPGATPNIILVDPLNAALINNPLHLQMNEEFSLGFPNSSGTGYIWIAQVDAENIVTVVKTKPIAVKKGNEPIVGYRILDVFVLSPHSPGSAKAQFSLQRPNGDTRFELSIPIIVEP
jgi:predicted secreted protein